MVMKNLIEILGGIHDAGEKGGTFQAEATLPEFTGLFTALRLRTDWGEDETRTPKQIEQGQEIAENLVRGNHRIARQNRT